MLTTEVLIAEFKNEEKMAAVGAAYGGGMGGSYLPLLAWIALALGCHGRDVKPVGFGGNKMGTMTAKHLQKP